MPKQVKTKPSEETGAVEGREDKDVNKPVASCLNSDEEDDANTACGACEVAMCDDDSTIQCEVCTYWFHITCENMPEDVYDYIERWAPHTVVK